MEEPFSNGSLNTTLNTLLLLVFLLFLTGEPSAHWQMQVPYEK